MASLRRPKLCWAPGIKPVACCPSDSLCRHYCTLPLGAPAGAGRGRAAENQAHCSCPAPVFLSSAPSGFLLCVVLNKMDIFFSMRLLLVLL